LRSVPTQKIPVSASFSVIASFAGRGCGDFELLPVTFLLIQSMIGCST
jgi:hypothetical protein